MTNICIFTEQLLQFCLGRRGIAWQPAPSNHQVDNANMVLNEVISNAVGLAWQPAPRNHPVGNPDMVFNEAIGNAVMNTSVAFQARVQGHSGDIWNRISRLTDPVAFPLLDYNINEVTKEIYHSDDAIENMYIFLAVMVDVAVKCTAGGRHQLIQHFAFIIPLILETRLPNGFHYSFNNMLGYAVSHSELPEN